MERKIWQFFLDKCPCSKTGDDNPLYNIIVVTKKNCQRKIVYRPHEQIKFVKEKLVKLNVLFIHTSKENMSRKTCQGKPVKENLVVWKGLYINWWNSDSDSVLKYDISSSNC